MVYTIKSSAAALSDTASTVSNANRVLIQHNANAGTSHLVTLKSDSTAGGPAIVGTFYIHPGQDIVIKKDRLFTLEVPNGTTDVYATSIGLEG
jgi:hypothetical protein